ncbi:unnamed protein product [Pleuronectes platessa]|uniref:Secreted protein n=1 Tax=Pleuronectes platessa TaxID=8262 RepID=A0A9N7UBA6_PLEPL|nr:unnamed protein product [Pleuronectes platessa]
MGIWVVVILPQLLSLISLSLLKAGAGCSPKNRHNFTNAITWPLALVLRRVREAGEENLLQRSESQRGSEEEERWASRWADVIAKKAPAKFPGCTSHRWRGGPLKRGGCPLASRPRHISVRKWQS